MRSTRLELAAIRADIDSLERRVAHQERLLAAVRNENAELTSRMRKQPMMYKARQENKRRIERLRVLDDQHVSRIAELKSEIETKTEEAETLENVVSGTALA